MQPVPVVSDQYTAARAYFVCIVGMFVFEGLIQIPNYVSKLRYQGRPPVKAKTSHSRVRVFFHKLSIFPSVVPFLTRHNVPTYLRTAVFVGLNILWGWNRVLYTTDYKLYGWLTIANGGLALLAAARTNLFSHILRIPSPVLLLYHRLIGRATVVHATLHFSLTADHYIKTDQLLDVLDSYITQAGLVAWCALCIVAITSISFVRRRWYEDFYYPHAFFLVFVIGALIHATRGPEFLLPGLLLWVCDRVIRFSRSFRSTSITSIVQYHGDMVKLRVDGIRPSHPGQIAWIQVPSVSLFKWHPFTIASAPEDGTATFAIRGLGGYTRKVQLLATDAANLRAESSDRLTATAAKNTTLKMRVDGPFGVGSLYWDQYPVILLVAGGIGITPGISIATHIMQRAVSKDSREPTSNKWHVHLLWVVKNIRHAMWFEEELKHLAAMAAASDSRATLDVTICVSGKNESPLGTSEQDDAYAMDEPYTFTGPGVVIHGRPSVLAWFRSVRAMRPNLDAAANLCGPKGLIDDARKAAARSSGVDGIIFVEEEVFEF